MTDSFSIRKILVVVDGTESSVRAVRYAARLAALHRAALTAIAVVDTATLKSLFKSSVLVEAEMEEFGQELEASARTNLGYAAQITKEAGIDAETLLEKGSVHSVIIQKCRQLGVELLVMGSFSTSMIRRDLTARERRLIVDEVKCPILLVS